MRKESGAVALLDGLISVAAACAGVLYLGLGVLITFAVLMRYFLNQPFAWVVEISEYALLWATLLGAPWVLRHDGHVRIDILVNKLRGGQRWVLENVNNVIGLCLSLLLTGLTFWTAYDAYVRKVPVIKMLAVPKFLVMSVIPLGFLLLSYQFGRRTAAMWRGLPAAGEE